LAQGLGGSRLLALCNLPRSHGRKGDFVFRPIKYTVVILRRHGQTLGRTHGGAQTAKAALGQVNVKPSGSKALGHAIASFANRRRRFDGIDLYTIYWTYLRALVANDAVINSIVKLVAPARRHR
jgi:hypothetical protein